MGYIPKKKVYHLNFTGTEYEGLEVRIRGLNTGQYLDLIGLKSAAESAEDDDAGMVELLQFMADQLVAWNLETEDGTPVPADLNGIRTQDLPLNLAIISAWQQAVADVPAPLETGSHSGGPSPVVSIPMEPLSLSQESSAVPA